MDAPQHPALLHISSRTRPSYGAWRMWSFRYHRRRPARTWKWEYRLLLPLFTSLDYVWNEMQLTCVRLDCSWNRSILLGKLYNSRNIVVAMSQLAQAMSNFHNILQQFIAFNCTIAAAVAPCSWPFGGKWDQVEEFRGTNWTHHRVWFAILDLKVKIMAWDRSVKCKRPKSKLQISLESIKFRADELRILAHNPSMHR